MVIPNVWPFVKFARLELLFNGYTKWTALGGAQSIKLIAGV